MNFRDEVYSAAKSNALVFLNKAIEELVSHDDSDDAPLGPGIATISSALLQVAFELSLVAYAVRMEGVATILTKKDHAVPERVIRERFINNELKTRSFDELLAQFGAQLFTADDLYHKIFKTFAIN